MSFARSKAKAGGIRKEIIMKKVFCICMLFMMSFIMCKAQSIDMEYGMGCLPETDIASIPKQVQFMERDFKDLPSKYSLLSYCPTPQSQGQYGTCTSWATAYAFRTILDAIRYEWTDKQKITKEAYSPLFIYAQIKNQYDSDCRQGSLISDAMKRLRDIGAVKKNTFDVLCASSVSSSLISSASANKISSYSCLVTYGQHVMEPVKISLIKKALSEKQPVVIAMHVYPSFNNCKDVWDGNISGISGYHAMCVVGYDDNKYGGAFLIQNSWGERWGNGGYTWVKYMDFCKTVDQAYTGVLPYTPSPVTKKNLLKGELNLQLSTGASMQVTLNKNDGLPHYDVRGSFISGTRYRLYLTNNEPAFVYIIGSDLNSNINRVFPPRDDISPALTYKQCHVAIPDEKWFIEMDNNPGIDFMCVLYAKHELDLKSVMGAVRRGSGTFYDKLKQALGTTLVPTTDINFSSSKISFDAATNGTVVPVIVTINHK